MAFYPERFYFPCPHTEIHTCIMPVLPIARVCCRRACDNVTSHLRRLVSQIGLYNQCNIHCISCNMSNTLQTCITAKLLHNVTHHRHNQATTYPCKITTSCPKVTFTLPLYVQPAQSFRKSTWNWGRILDLVWICCIFATKY